MRLNVPADKMEKFIEKLEKLNKSSQSPFSIKIYDPIEKLNNGENHLIFPVDIQGQPYKLDGDYRILGTLRPSVLENKSNHDNIVVDINDKFKIPEKYRHTDICKCEHCDIKRDRLISFIVAKIDHEKTNLSDKEEYSNFMQVGSVCIKNFTDGRNLNDLLKSFDLYNDLTKIAESEPQKIGLTKLVKVEDYIHDYLKAKELYPKSSLQTIEKIAAQKFNPMTSSAEAFYAEAIHRVKNESNEIDKLKTKSLIDYIKFAKDEGDNDLYSCKVLLAQNYVFMHQTLPLQRTIEKVTAEEQRLKREKDLEEARIIKAKRSHVGELEQRGEFIVRLEKVIPLQGGMWGPSYLHVFRDQNENNIISYMSNKTLFDIEEKDKNINEKVFFKLAGRVEEYATYNDEPQTKLSRIKFVSYDLEPALKKERKKKQKNEI